MTGLLFIAIAKVCSQGEYILELDPATGSYIQPDAPITGITFVSGAVSTYDEIHGLYTFPASTVNGLFTVTTNDSIVFNPPYTSLRECQYDNSSGILYCIKNNSSGQSVFGSVDPATANLTQIGSGPISGMSGTYQGMSTFDRNNHRYIIYGTGNKLFSIDAITGNVLSNPSLQLNSGEGLLHVCYDDSTGSLFGLLQNSSQTYLVKINTTLGTVTKIGSGSAYGLGGGTSTIDKANRQYIYHYSVNGKYFIAGLDITSGNLIYNNPILFAPGGNINTIEYDNVKKKLYAQHWDISKPSGINAHSKQYTLDFYPNPFSTETTFQTDKSLRNATLSVYNCFGQIVAQINNINGQTATFTRDYLASGIYVVWVTEENNTIAVDKLVITD